MAARNNQTLTHHLRRIVLRVDGGGMTDGQLLEAFIRHRDAAAFEALVRRHGPMVLGVCRRILRDPHDADDAFQAAFLVLARKADSVSPRDRVGNFLYGVAHTTAVRARAANAKRRSRERPMLHLPEREAVANDGPDDLHERLDHELARLPDKYRVPIVLCDLEGRTRREVARQLQIPEGTLSSRLTTARRMLAKRLARHGLAVSGGGLAAALSPSATSASVPVSLVSSTVKAATFAAAGQAATGIISFQVAALTQGVLKAMFLTKLKTIVGVMLVVASVCGAAGLIYPTQAANRIRARSVSEGAPALADASDSDQSRLSAGPKPDKEQLQGTWKTVGYITIKDGPQAYDRLFTKMLDVIDDQFDQPNYVNRYEGRIEAYKIEPTTSRRTAVQQHAFVQFETRDDGYLITVRINKGRMSGTKPEQVVGRNIELEESILKKLKAQPVQKDSLPPETPPARSEPRTQRSGVSG